MFRLASLIRSAMTRRTPMTLISVVSGRGAPIPDGRAPDGGVPGGGVPGGGVPGGGVPGVSSGRPAKAKSPVRMRPPGPDPAMVVKSIPASRALRRFAGDAFTRPRLGRWLEAAAIEATGGATAATGAPPGAASSNTIRGDPTAILSPGSPEVDTTVPLTGAGTSTAALSVMTSTMIWSSLTESPGLVCHATISASTVPSPKSGILKMN